MENIEEKRIESLQEFIAWVKDFHMEKPDKEHFFRGHSKLSYELKPAVYRPDVQGKSLRASERNMYYEMLNRVPHEFDHDDVFGNLVKMQHFGIPTRLLDVTKNSLVALYFACAGNSDTDGRIYGFEVDVNSISFPVDLPQSCLYFPDYKRISPYGGRSGEDFWEIFMNGIVCQLRTMIGSLRDRHLTDAQIETVNKWQSDLVNCEGDWNESQYELLSELLKNLSDSVSDFPDLAELLLGKEMASFVKVQYKLSSEVPVFQWLWVEMTRPMFVLPPLNNARVLSQQGGFILFPPHPYAVRKDFYVQGRDTRGDSVMVPGDMKFNIKKELEYLGVSEHVLFPEIDKVARHVCEKYSI